MLKVYDFDQGSADWLCVRLGVPTASEANAVMSNGRGSSLSVTAKKYAYKLAAQRITAEMPEQWSNADTERGHLHEPIARELYIQKTGNQVKEVGFGFNGLAGASPDGLVGDDGGLEIKSKKPELHIECLLENKVPPEHIKQIQTNLWVWERKWWDFVSYCPGLPLCVIRVQRDDELILDIQERFTAFEEYVENLVEKIMEAY